MTASSTHSVSRRGVLKTLGATAGVIGFDAATGLWTLSAQAQTQTSAAFAAVPRLDGTLHLDDATRNEYAQDFGAIVHEQPVAVLRPGSVDDIARMVAFARRHGIRIAGRGMAHTAFGQAQVQAGIVIDISTLNTIHRIDRDRIDGPCIDVDAGIRWNTLLDATLAQGLMPPALTDYIGQTVGGTLSVGGVGAMTHRHGTQVDNVIELSVVTGRGKVVQCSATRRRDLFEAVLAGQGQVGIIVRATMTLIAAPQRIRVFDLVYTELAAMTGDIRRLMTDQRFDVLEAFALPLPDGTWIYLLQAGSCYDPPAQPNAAALLDGLHDQRFALGTEDHTLSAFANRVPVNLPKQPHPWIDLILPDAAIEPFVGAVEQTLKPLVNGDTFQLLLIPMRTGLFTRPLFRAPASDFAFGFGILRFMPDDAGAVEQAVAYNRTLFDQCRDLGGTHYPISAVRLDRDDWVRHYGEQFGKLEAAKRRHDPDNVFASGPDFLG
jgi:cytokinin dehydrogenase